MRKMTDISRSWRFRKTAETLKDTEVLIKLDFLFNSSFISEQQILSDS